MNASKEPRPGCGICGKPMTQEPGSAQNLGDDCLACMAEAGDPDALAEAFTVQKRHIARLDRALQLALFHLRRGDRTDLACGDSVTRQMVDSLERALAVTEPQTRPPSRTRAPSNTDAATVRFSLAAAPRGL